MTSTDLIIPDLLYFQHRLNILGQAQVPATMRYDLARTPVDNETLHQTAQTFGAPANPHENDWGVASFFSHLASTQPDTIASPNLTAVQDKLKSAGYLDPAYPVSGEWDSVSQAALGQWERQQTNDFYAGKHLGATTTQKALQALGWMLPSQVFQGLVGAAKGFVQQTPETVERVGLAGGAAAGAAIGASIGAAGFGVGAVPGALIGAGIGAAVGFFGDLLTHDESEGDQTELQKIWDAITPYEEYTGEGGFGKFMEDVGWVATASALITGAGAGVKAAALGVGQIAGAAEEAGTGFWAQALAKGASEEVGWSSKITSHIVGLANADKGAQLLDFYKARGLIAQTSRPIIQDVIQPAFTGASSAQFAARATSNLGAGENETTIHKAISEAPLLKTGIEIPLLGDIVDLPSFVINPTQFLPWRLGDLTRGITRAMDTDPGIEALVNIVRSQEPSLSNEAAHARVTAMLGSTPAEVESRLSMLRLEYGVEARSYELALEKFNPNKDRELFFKGMEGIKDDLRSKVYSEIGSEPVVTAGAREYQGAREAAIMEKGKPSLLKSIDTSTVAEPVSQTLRELMSYSARDQGGFEAYMTRLSNNGSGIEGLENYFKASELTKGFTEGVRANTLVPLGTDGKLMSPGVNRAGSRIEVAEAEKNVKLLEKQIDELQHQTDAFVYEPAEVQANIEAIQAGKKKLADAQALLKSLKRKSNASWDDRTIVAERLDTPTKWDYLDWSRQYGDLSQQMEIALENRNMPAYDTLKQMQRSFLEQHEDHIPSTMFERARRASKPKDEIPGFFEKMSRSAPEEAVFSDPNLPDQLVNREELQALGYKAVVRHTKNTFDYAVDPRITEVTGINDYTARHTFYESLGFGVNPYTDRSIAQLRSLAQERGLDQLSAESGWGISGEHLMNRLHRALNEADYSGVVNNSVVTALRDRGDPVTLRAGFLIPAKGGLRHFAVDMRDLRPGDVWESLRDIKGFTQKDAAKVFGQLQAGGAFGAELNFARAPLQAAHELGRVMRISGWQGFTDIARRWHMGAPAQEMRGITTQRVRRLLTASAIGAGAGFIFGDDKLTDALAGAGIGLATGLGVQAMAKRSYGYLPDYLYKVTTAMRYSLSPSFDVRRFVKQNLLAATTHDLPPVMNAPRHIRGREWKSLYGEGTVSGDKAWGEAKQLWDELNGVGYNEALDTFDRTLYASGILGYNPQNRQMAHAFMLAQRGWKTAKIKSALKDIYTYGPGRSAMEKSINYVFFPFSFEKKLLTTMGDFLLQHPARAVLLHEGMRRWYASTWATDVQDFLNDHVPLLSQIREFNAFSHGIAPGRFLFQGAGEHRTAEGTAAQLVASFFVPGGAASQPIQAAAGAIGDLAISAFHPVVVTGESLTRMGVDLSATNQSANTFFDEIGGKYIPLINDLQELYNNASDQVEAIRHGESPWAQVHDYYQEVGAQKRQLEPLAAAFGYSSPEGFMASDLGAPWKAQYEENRYQLAKRYPDAANAAATFENTASVVERAKQDILHSRDTSAAYSAVREVIAIESGWKAVSAGVDPAIATVYDRTAASQIRAVALQHAGDDRFAELWAQLFEPTYGPIRIEAA